MEARIEQALHKIDSNAIAFELKRGVHTSVLPLGVQNA